MTNPMSEMELWKAFLFDVLIPECRKRGYAVDFESTDDATCTISANLNPKEVPMEQLSFLPDEDPGKAIHYYQD